MPYILADLEAPLEPVQFPNGKVFAVRALDAAGYEMLAHVQAHPEDNDAAVALLKRCVPDATDADLATVVSDSGRMVAGLLAHVARKLNLVMAHLKNPSAPGTTPLPPRRSRARSRSRGS